MLLSNSNDEPGRANISMASMRVLAVIGRLLPVVIFSGHPLDGAASVENLPDRAGFPLGLCGRQPPSQVTLKMQPGATCCGKN